LIGSFSRTTPRGDPLKMSLTTSSVDWSIRNAHFNNLFQLLLVLGHIHSLDDNRNTTFVYEYNII